jgi:hypothetical protein
MHFTLHVLVSLSNLHMLSALHFVTDDTSWQFCRQVAIEASHMQRENCWHADSVDAMKGQFLRQTPPSQLHIASELQVVGFVMDVQVALHCRALASYMQRLSLSHAALNAGRGYFVAHWSMHFTADAFQ